MFKRFGEKISLPVLLEEVKQHWNGEAQFYLKTDSNGEHAHVLVLSPVPEDVGIVKKILVAFRKRFSRAFWPIAVESVDSFPLLENGKIDQRRLSSDHCEKNIIWQQKGVI